MIGNPVPLSPVPTNANTSISIPGFKFHGCGVDGYGYTADVHSLPVSSSTLKTVAVLVAEVRLHELELSLPPDAVLLNNCN